MATRRVKTGMVRLTTRQVSEVRAGMMKTAALIGHQLHKYIDKGELIVAGKPIELNEQRLKAWKLVLDRTIPTLSASEVTHKSGLESMDSGALIGRLVELAKQRPELASRLQEALGGKVIDHQAVEDNHQAVESQETIHVPTT